MPLTQVQGGMILPSTTLTTPIVATTMGVGGATPAASGSGITFPATQSASTDANTLDDYEEGTFTPTLTASSGSPIVPINVCSYVKIGRMVSITMNLTVNKNTASGPLTITSLPFVVESGYFPQGTMLTDFCSSTYDNPIVLGTWNMHNFKTDNENGKTYFIDSEKAYNEMPEDWKSFLGLCKINNPNPDTDQSIDDFSPIVNHWISGNPLIRLAPRNNLGSGSTLKSVDNREATQTEKDLFEEIFMWFGNYVYNNQEDRIVHKWQQGDLLIVDIFKMNHAVTGGFDPADREFIGMWGYKDPINN
jgi:hypothetical protein